MMIDVEVVEKKNNNYLFLLLFLLGGFLYTLKIIFYNIGILKIKNIFYKEEIKYFADFENDMLFNAMTQINNNQMNLLTNPLFNYESNKYLSDTIINNYNNFITDIKYNNLLDFSSISN
jgi:hypothetical protein